MRGMRRHWLGAMLLAGAALPAVAAAPLPDSFDLGRGPQGELCRADRIWSDPAASGMFDRVYGVRCRGWTDTGSVGRLFLVTAGAKASAAVAAQQDARMSCGAPAAVTVERLGRGEGRRCLEREAGYDAVAVSIPRGKQLLVVEGLGRFLPNLLAGARAMAGVGKVPTGAELPKATIDLGAAPAPAAGALAGARTLDREALDGRKVEVLDYSIRGQHSEAREIVTRYLARLPADVPVGDRIEFTLDAALSESNLGYGDIAGAYLDRAATLLAGPDAPRGSLAEELRTKLAVYRAVDALNRRDFANAATLASAALALDPSAGAEVAGGGPLQDPFLLRQINNAGGSRSLTARDTSWVRPLILRAQTLYVRGAALRAQGQFQEAQEVLRQAERLMQRFDDSGLELSNLLWLRSGVAAEQGRVAMRLKQPAEARAAFARAASVLERSSVYADTPLVAQRRIEYANALLAVGDGAAARKEFDQAVAVLRANGPSASAGITGLDGYFGLLAAEIARGGAGAEPAKATFFEASQLISPPAVATQIAQLQKIFESGSSDAAVRAKALQDLDRDARAIATRLSTLPPSATRDRAALEAELGQVEARAAQVRSELAGDQQFQQAAESVVTLTELKNALAPNEAYLKLLSLAQASYAIVVRREGVAVYATTPGTAGLAKLAATVRQSIDGTVAADGRVIPLVYDVESAFALKEALLGPADSLLNGATTLVTEPSGPMTQLPFGVLVADKASVDAFAESVKLNSRDYSRVRFVAGAYRIDTAVSPRSFVIGRTQTPTRAQYSYLGLGNHARPTPTELAALPNRGAFAGRCAVRADALRAGFAAMKSIGAAELATAAKVMGADAKVVQQDAFTDSALDDGKGLGGTLRDFAVVHFATHGLKEGELDCDSPPALITSIAETGDSDGLLSFEEIAGLSMDANLVVLSACNTAAQTTASRASGSGFRARPGQAATLNGLVRAFLVAGSRAVLTTHWAIPDSFRARDGRQVAASTALVGTLFEAGVKGGMGDALKTAQTTMIANVDTSHPYYWGAFMLVGDGSRSMLARAK
ncbi:CHAT domain-containing protein [Sandaracinobacteroides saxicola]|uniref:CHAT domain-containing protein n=1 Tax=Sandaracinobacteroides saxicola TaxID=2759707 RepID=A0A7G5IJ04_9SPHN|nr:CHAT domain-containing protein [Sandaracinobacteroides saxicola]QMW23346.1 CHAT domain-containing protein [Sandaracinobacteroides saxicola]